jgi:hypothetical protein
MSELKFIAIFSLIPIAFFVSLQIAIFLGVLGVLIWLFFFVPKPIKSRSNSGNSITDKAGEPPMV